MNPLLIRRRCMVGGPQYHKYLVFDGLAYVTTDIMLSADCSFALSMGHETQKKPQGVLYVPCENNGSTGFGINSSNTTYRYFTVYYQKAAAVISGTTKRLAWSFNAYSLAFTHNKFGQSNVLTSFTKGNEQPNGALTIGLCPPLTSNAFTGQTQFIRIYNYNVGTISSFSDLSSFTPSYILYPCIYRGEAGLWCLETNRFYGNSAGAGTLTVVDD